MSYSKEELVRYRFQRAKEAFEDGVLLASNQRWNAVANRLYYACFYVVSSYFAKKEITAFTHSGLKSAFNKELVKSGKISMDDGILFNKLFSLRQEADYEDFQDISQDEIEALVPKIKGLIDDIETLINSDS